MRDFLVDLAAELVAFCAAVVGRVRGRGTELRRRQVVLLLGDGLARDEDWICNYLAGFVGKPPADFLVALLELEDAGVVVRVAPSVYRLSCSHRTVQ